MTAVTIRRGHRYGVFHFYVPEHELFLYDVSYSYDSRTGNIGDVEYSRGNMLEGINLSVAGEAIPQFIHVYNSEREWPYGTEWEITLDDSGSMTRCRYLVPLDLEDVTSG